VLGQLQIILVGERGLLDDGTTQQVRTAHQIIYAA
jgi:hypothetical protein